MDRLIMTALAVIGMYVWVFKKYGIMAMATKKVCRHADVGRAKWQAFWNVPVRDHRQLALSASDLIAKLRAERARTEFALAA